MSDPASIRFNNPGAQYPGASARRYGSTGTEIIGGGHKIAVFDDPVKGAAAQLDLLRNNYSGMTLSDALRKWSGGNSSDGYIDLVSKSTGLAPSTQLTPELLSNPSASIPLLKAMARQEAGRDYPLTDDQWASAHALASGQQVAPQAVALAAPQTIAEQPVAASPAAPEPASDDFMGRLKSYLAESEPAQSDQKQPSQPPSIHDEEIVIPQLQNLVRSRLNPQNLQRLASLRGKLGTVR